MTIIPIGERFRVVDEPGADNSPGRFTFEQQTTDAAGRKNWDVCQSERGGLLTLPWPLVNELVRGLLAKKETNHAAPTREQTPARPMTIRRVGPGSF